VNQLVLVMDGDGVGWRRMLAVGGCRRIGPDLALFHHDSNNMMVEGACGPGVAYASLTSLFVSFSSHSSRRRVEHITCTNHQPICYITKRQVNC
jgi:hypothetical protein